MANTDGIVRMLTEHVAEIESTNGRYAARCVEHGDHLGHTDTEDAMLRIAAAHEEMYHDNQH